MIPALKTDGLWLLPNVSMSQDQRKSTKMDFWDMWLDSSGHNCLCRMVTPKENREEKEEGPWEESLT
eukprot:6311069-Prorocentrum_lima.AAC.1